MGLHHRVLRGTTNISVLTTLALAACSGAGDTGEQAAPAVVEEAVIAGVDARSPSLNAVGSLVEVYRYTVVSCGAGGGSGFGGKPGLGGASSSSISAGPEVDSPDDVIQRHGHLDRLRSPASLAASAKPAAGTGGTSAVGGSPALAGGTKSMGGTPGVGGTSNTCTSTEVVRYYPFCTATLVGPTAVQTAKHCIMNFDYYGDQVEFAFAVGPDASNPTAAYPIVDWEWESEVPSDPNSLLSDLGSDVGVVHLGAPVTGVTPMSIGTLSDADIGKRFTILGYGIQNNYEEDGTRKAGSLTLRGFGGNYADYVFGGLEGFLKGAQSMPDFAGLPEWYLIEIYAELTLLPEYQAFLGGRPGDAQPCFGDSGGPLIAMRNGVRTVFGNVTSGLGSNRLICDFGAVFAVFGPATQTFLQRALSWVDPCAGVTVKGYCDGDLAIRCTARNEGQRRLSETDCGLLGQTCGLDSTGTVACVDPI